MHASYNLFGFEVATNFPFRTPMASSDARADLCFKRTLVKKTRDLDPATQVYACEELNELGESTVSLFRMDDGTDVMRFPRVADFIIRADAIECELLNPEYEFMVEICLLGHVFGYFLERSNITAVHAASIAVNEQAALFIADRGGGKSTLAASFLQAGFPLISDDISPIENRDGALICRRAYPQIKLTPEQAAEFMSDTREYPLVHPAFRKKSVPVSAIGTFAPHPLPVGAIYVLNRQREATGPVRIEPVSPGESLVELIKNSFVTEITEATSLREARMKRLGHLVRTVPVKRLQHPTAFQRLPEVHQAVLRDLKNDGARSTG